MKLPRFSLRELFLLVVIAAMGCGWWVERLGRLRAESVAADSADNVESAKHWFAHRGYYVSPDWSWIAEPGTYRFVCKECDATFEPEDREHYGDLAERAQEAGWTGDPVAGWLLCPNCSKPGAKP